MTFVHELTNVLVVEQRFCLQMAAFIRVLQSNKMSVTASILVFPCCSQLCFPFRAQARRALRERAVSAVPRTFARACHAPTIVVRFTLLTIVC
jgi:hypothetical protein